MNTITITVPDSLYSKVRELAEQDASSVEQFAVLALAEKMSSLVTVSYLEERARRAEPGTLTELLANAPDVEPEEADGIG
jgi:predicted transcriptional regulator